MVAKYKSGEVVEVDQKEMVVVHSWFDENYQSYMYNVSFTAGPLLENYLLVWEDEITGQEPEVKFPVGSRVRHDDFPDMVFTVQSYSEKWDYTLESDTGVICRWAKEKDLLPEMKFPIGSKVIYKYHPDMVFKVKDLSNGGYYTIVGDSVNTVGRGVREEELSLYQEFRIGDWVTVEHGTPGEITGINELEPRYIIMDFSGDVFFAEEKRLERVPRPMFEMGDDVIYGTYKAYCTVRS
jgi:hypothetical protein